MATKYIINNEDGLITTGQTINGGISATTISATTYQGLPIDPDTYVTAFTYSSNTLTINDNSGNTFSSTINDFTGLTINGDLTVTGNTSVQGLSATTISADTIYVSGNSLTKSYKVYTALLTQSGGGNVLFIDNGSLQIGVTYYIDMNSPGMDFTNVGAPSNNVGTYFVAIGTTPNSWGSEAGTNNGTLRYNTGAPIVTILENTLGNVWFEYGSTGLYVLNATGLLTLGKTWVTFNYINSNIQTVSYNGKSLNAFSILSRNSVGASSDNILDGTEIEIRVYN